VAREPFLDVEVEAGQPVTLWHSSALRDAATVRRVGSRR
jgi:hypothetical protein